MNLDHFGMDTITLAGPLEAKLRAVKAAGFAQIMLNASDIVGHPDGESAAIAAVRASGLSVTGFQVLRDFEGLSGHLHAYKVDVAKTMLEMCHALGSSILLACSSTSAHATGETDSLKADLQKLAMLAVPLDIRIAYEALSPGQRLVCDANVERDRQHRQLLQICLQGIRFTGRMRGSRRAGEQDAGAQRVAHLQHRFRHIDLVRMQVTRKAFEIAQHLESGHAEPACAHRGDRGAFAVGMPDNVGGVQHDLRESRRLHRAQLRFQRACKGDRVHPEVIEVHGLRWLTTNSN